MNPASASSPLSFVLVQEPAKISNIDLSHKHKSFSYSVQFQTRSWVLCTRMENWRYFFVSSFVLLCCLRDAKSEKSDNEIDKTKWTPKLRDPVKVICLLSLFQQVSVQNVGLLFEIANKIIPAHSSQPAIHEFRRKKSRENKPSGTFQEQSKIFMLLHA